MENTELLVDATEEVVTETTNLVHDGNKTFLTAGIAVGVGVVGVLTYKFAIKPIVNKIKKVKADKAMKLENNEDLDVEEEE